MATAQPTTPDTMITLKVNYEGVTRRFKLPLREMGPTTLGNRIRSFIGLDQETQLLIERYSDSASAYVILNPTNAAVFKQLYRAAKAKQKLKLRVTKQGEEMPQPKLIPHPVTIEDVPENQTAAPTANVVPKVEAPSQPEIPADQQSSRASEKAPAAPQPPAPVSGTDSFESALLASLMHHQARLDDEQRAKSETPEIKEEAKQPLQWWPSSAAGRCPAMPAAAPFAVCCNSCDKHIPDSHYHCSTCDDGDFDLCQTCVDQGITCYGDNHWLIKRVVKNGQIHTSTTERVAPKPKAAPAPVERPVSLFAAAEPVAPPMFCIRTCNCCVQELPERSFVHCTACEDFDLCMTCFERDAHGHNPKHAFVSAVEGAYVPAHVFVKLAPGRNQRHHAVCDGCDKYINGVRHKCLDCPDWDYCADCILNAKFVHPNHRFVPVYEPLDEVRRLASRAVHFGICCDGPLCSRGHGAPSYIAGVRYKCTVCHDTDFCANCEASPANTHNKTHPLVKFKTPVRHVSVTTTGERGNGQRLPQLGDRTIRRTCSRPVAPATAALNTVQTVVDVKPVEPAKETPEKVETPAPIKSEPKDVPSPIVAPAATKAPSAEDLVAVFVKDTVADGSVLPTNHVFEQTWVLRNDGPVAWPAGSSVKFVGGDYMGIASSSHPAGISELVSASESTKCYAALAPGQEFPFTVLLRTPAREGRIISYWRLTTDDGIKFGHRLWCDISVRPAQAAKEEVKPKVEEPVPEITKETPKTAVVEDTETQSSSQMIFPKLEKESPVASIHQDAKSEVEEPAPEAEADADADAFDEVAQDDDEWDASDDGFMTDEEYDVLDASDEEYLEEQQKKTVSKK